MWLHQPLLVRLAPRGRSEDNAAQTTLRIGLVDPQYAETCVSSKESRAAWDRLIAKVYETDPFRPLAAEGLGIVADGPFELDGLRREFEVLPRLNIPGTDIVHVVEGRIRLIVDLN